MGFELPKLTFEYSALEPFIDEETMRIHHDKHHQAYIDNLNKALEGKPDLQSKSTWDLLSNLTSVPEDIRLKVQNNAGGHANHTFFWKLLISSDKSGEMSDELKKLVENNFESIDIFKEKFKESALSRFGSGWAWLVLTEEGKLEITSTANQDTPWMEGKDAILGLDVWEHAYYLKYQNKRVDYINNWWNVVNWGQVSENLKKAQSYLK